MSNILSAIRDDIDTYVALCEKLGEKVQYDHHGVDVYGEHAQKVREITRYVGRCERFQERVRRHQDGSIDYNGRHARAMELRERGPKPKAQPKFRPSRKLVRTLERTIETLRIQLKEHTDRVNSQIAAAITELDKLRETCKHKWVSLGGFIYNEERCVRCGKTETY